MMTKAMAAMMTECRTHLARSPWRCAQIQRSGQPRSNNTKTGLVRIRTPHKAPATRVATLLWVPRLRSVTRNADSKSKKKHVASPGDLQGGVAYAESAQNQGIQKWIYGSNVHR